jgi:hypothetical protein
LAHSELLENGEWAIMGWFIPIAAASFVGRQLIRRPVMSAAGGIIAWEFFDMDGTPVGQWAEREVGGALSDLANEGINVVTDYAERGLAGIGNAIPEIIERLGPAVVTGINNTVVAIRDELRGQELKVLTTFLTFLLIWATGIYIISWVRGAGEAAHMMGV